MGIGMGDLLFLISKLPNANRILKYSFLRLLKKVQMQGGAPQSERGVL